MNQSPRLTIVFFALLLALPPFAAAEERPATPWFDVEVIVFTRDAKAAGSDELWTADPGAPQLEGAWHLRPAGSSDGEPGYTLLPRSQWRMKPDAYALRNSRAELTPLIHLAWRQPVLSRGAAHPVSLRSDKRSRTNTPQLQGVMKVSVNRYLHVDLDLLLQGALKQQGENGDFIPGEFQTYRFQAHRRMRSGEIHYIDHPLMGALILISRFETPGTLPENEGKAQEASANDSSAADRQPANVQPAN